MAVVEITGRDPRSGKTIRVLTEGGMITRVEESEAGSDFYISAGFVDLQVNGFAGLDINAADVSTYTIIGVVDALLAQGVTCFAPTVITTDEDSICHALSVIAQARRISPRAAACIPYAHVEGPHISPLEGYRGAHPVDSIRPPSIAEFERWQEASGGIVGLVTMSPHYPNSAEYIAHLVRKRVHVAIGHTHATAEQIRRAADAGASLSTHLGNGIAAEIPRHHNAIWSQLADERLTATVIADGHHLPREVLQVILRAKGLERTVLVSDAVALAGMLAGNYDTPVGGKVELRADGRLCLAGTELLAGSTATLRECVGNFIRATGIPLADALLMATANPGRFIGGCEKLAPASYADVIRFRWSEKIEIEDVWLRGECVYAR
jgi:N-acetylglucosamine-6-phosphate deacetylase